MLGRVGCPGNPCSCRRPRCSGAKAVAGSKRVRGKVALGWAPGLEVCCPGQSSALSSPTLGHGRSAPGGVAHVLGKVGQPAQGRGFLRCSFILHLQCKCVTPHDWHIPCLDPLVCSRPPEGELLRKVPSSAGLCTPGCSLTCLGLWGQIGRRGTAGWGGISPVSVLREVRGDCCGG